VTHNSFNKSHAASYGMVSYVTAYLKFNYPAEYMAALLSTSKTQDDLTKYLNESNNMGIEILPPSINKSLPDFRVENDKAILFGLASIKGVGQAIVDCIMDGRGKDYISIYDFMRRTNTDVLNKAILEHLYNSGAFDEIIVNQPEMMINREQKMSILDAERAELGFYITENPLAGVWHALEPLITSTIEDLSDLLDGTNVTVGGLISKVEKKNTRRGQTMYILELDDLTGSTTIVVFPGAVKGQEFEEGSIVTIDGRVAQEGDEEHSISKIYFESINYPEVPDFDYGEPIFINFQNVPDYDIITRIQEAIQSCPGDRPVKIVFPDGYVDIVAEFVQPVSSEIEEELEFLSRSQINV